MNTLLLTLALLMPDLTFTRATIDTVDAKIEAVAHVPASWAATFIPGRTLHKIPMVPDQVDRFIWPIIGAFNSQDNAFLASVSFRFSRNGVEIARLNFDAFPSQITSPLSPRGYNLLTSFLGNAPSFQSPPSANQPNLVINFGSSDTQLEVPCFKFRIAADQVEVVAELLSPGNPATPPVGFATGLAVISQYP